MVGVSSGKAVRLVESGCHRDGLRAGIGCCYRSWSGDGWSLRHALFPDTGGSGAHCGRDCSQRGKGCHCGPDTSDRASCQRLIDQTVSRFGKLDVLVNNAGIDSISPAEDLTDDAWEQRRQHQPQRLLHLFPSWRPARCWHREVAALLLIILPFVQSSVLTALRFIRQQKVASTSSPESWRSSGQNAAFGSTQSHRDISTTSCRTQLLNMRRSDKQKQVLLLPPWEGGDSPRN